MNKCNAPLRSLPWKWRREIRRKRRSYDRETDRKRQTERYADGERDREGSRYRGIDGHMCTTDRHTETDRQTEMQTERDRERRYRGRNGHTTERQTDSEKR